MSSLITMWYCHALGIGVCAAVATSLF